MSTRALDLSYALRTLGRASHVTAVVLDPLLLNLRFSKRNPVNRLMQVEVLGGSSSV